MPPNRIEKQATDNRNTTDPSIAKQTLTQEDQINFELIKKILTEKNTTLPSLRNKKKVKVETKMVNKLSPNIRARRRGDLLGLISTFPKRAKRDKKELPGLGSTAIGLLYDLENVDNRIIDNRIFKNVQNIRKGHKLHHKIHEKLESIISSVEKIQRVIFQGDALLHLLFALSMMPLYYTLRKGTEGYKFIKSPEKIYLLMYRDDIKLLAKKERKRIEE